MLSNPLHFLLDILFIDNDLAYKPTMFFFFEQVRQTFGARERVVTSSKKKRIGKPQNCFNLVQRRVHKRSHRDKTIPHANASPSNFTKEAVFKKESTDFEDTSGAPIVKNKITNFEDPRGAASSAPPSQESTNFENSSGATIVKKESTHFEDLKDVASSTPLSQEITNFKDLNGAVSSAPSSQGKDLTKENVAAVKIQAIFRGHRVHYPTSTFPLDILFINNDLACKPTMIFGRQDEDFCHLRAWYQALERRETREEQHRCPKIGST